MKKSKVIIISLLGMLIFIPFMTSARAQTVAANVSLTEGDYLIWQQSMDYAVRDVWEADNMTAHFDEVYNHTGDGSDITLLFISWSTLPWTRPLFDLPVNVTSIGPVNATTGDQDINFTLGYRHLYLPAGYLWNATTTFFNNTPDLAESWSNGSQLTSPNWVGYYPGVLAVSPDVNWTEMAEICDAGMKWGLLNGGFNYNLTVTALANGMSILMPANEFGNNSRDITLSVIYDSEGLLAHYFFKYGSDMLVEIWLEDPDDPAITVAPIDAAVANNYTGESLSWTATDANPDLYTIWVNTTEVASDVAWTSGTPVVYNIPDGLGTGIHTYRINYKDYQGNSASDTVLFTVEEEVEPTPTPTPTPTPQIPGFEPFIIIGTSAIATLALIFIIKKRK